MKKLLYFYLHFNKTHARYAQFSYVKIHVRYAQHLVDHIKCLIRRNLERFASLHIFKYFLSL